MPAERIQHREQEVAFEEIRRAHALRKQSLDESFEAARHQAEAHRLLQQAIQSMHVAKALRYGAKEWVIVALDINKDHMNSETVALVKNLTDLFDAQE